MANIKKYLVGDIYEVPSGKFEVIGYSGRHLVVKWLDSFQHIQNVRSDVISKGNIKNPYYPSVEGAGYVGVGKHLKSAKEKYNSWASMIARTHRARLKEKYPTYLDCTCSEEWLDFQKYGDFFESCPYRMSGWSLDKDLLYIGNKHYSKETCVYLPGEINTSLLYFGKQSNTASGFKGVYRDRDKWMASARTVTGEGCGNTTLGRFSDVRDAAIAVLEADTIRFESLAERYANKIDPRAVSALMERAYILKQKVLEVSSGR